MDIRGNQPGMVKITVKYGMIFISKLQLFFNCVVESLRVHGLNFMCATCNLLLSETVPWTFEHAKTYSLKAFWGFLVWDLHQVFYFLLDWFVIVCPCCFLCSFGFFLAAIFDKHGVESESSYQCWTLTCIPYTSYWQQMTRCLEVFFCLYTGNILPQKLVLRHLKKCQLYL